MKFRWIITPEILIVLAESSCFLFNRLVMKYLYESQAYTRTATYIINNEKIIDILGQPQNNKESLSIISGTSGKNARFKIEVRGTKNQGVVIIEWKDIPQENPIVINAQLIDNLGNRHNMLLVLEK